MQIKLDIWDTAGQERFHTIVPMYYRGAQGAIVMYDITSEESLEKAKIWIHKLRADTSVPKNIPIVLAGNKVNHFQPSLVSTIIIISSFRLTSLQTDKSSMKMGSGSPWKKVSSFLKLGQNLR